MLTKYPVDNCVTIWVGVYPSEESLDVDIDTILEPELNLSVHLSAICEYTFEDETDVASLLEGFSGSNSFLEKSVNSAAKQNIARANAALICYYLKVENCPPTLGGLKFLGSFEGSDVQDV